MHHGELERAADEGRLDGEEGIGRGRGAEGGRDDGREGAADAAGGGEDGVGAEAGGVAA